MSSTPVWLKAVTTREGEDIVTRCCVVTEGQYFPIEVRVNVPRLAASLRSLGLAGDGTDGVGGFGSWLKKAVKSVTKSKVVKAVGHVVSKVAKNPIVQLANPMLAISTHTISRAATGKGTIRGPAGQLVDAGTAAVMKVVPVPNALNFVSPKTAAALGVGLRTVTTARAGNVIADVAKKAQAQVNLGRIAAQGLVNKTVSPAAGKAIVQRAVNLRANVQKAAPALAKKVVESSKVKASIANIAKKAQAGNVDARLAASVIARSASALDQISRLQQASAGGVAGLLVTSDGRIVRAPRGRFTLRASAVARPDVLYRGPKDPTLRGAFSAVGAKMKRRPKYQPGVTRLKRELQRCAEAYDEIWEELVNFTGEQYPHLDDPHVINAQGWAPPPTRGIIGATSSWGGDLDPGNDIDGPAYRVTHPGGRVLLDDYSAVAGLLTP